MANLKKISSTLSIAATVLIQSCGNSASEPNTGLIPVENTKAPALVGYWSAGCKTVSITGTSTITGSSGSVIQSGTAVKELFNFRQDGRLEISAEKFASIDCNANTSVSVAKQDLVYLVGEGLTANDGSPVIGIDYSDPSASLYSIFQVVDSTSLYLGDLSASSAGNDGKSISTRYDGLGFELTKR
ncbi:MAG: hypothetical protein IMF15_09640 [Proteobacteria bacterium]|nr:hypothetical protein [Pseudomonadota bacterium]